MPPSTDCYHIVYSFRQARALFRSSSKLLTNEYGIIGDAGALQHYLGIINILTGKGLIDGIGIDLTGSRLIRRKRWGCGELILFK
jgi:endo-1,4-beta-xylanase